MNLLIIDTATKVARVLVKKSNDIFYDEINNEITHSEKLLPLIDSVLKKSNISVDDIDAFGVTTGPGSFTGIRIGIATIKALAVKNNTPIYSISNLDLLARNVKFSSYICPMFDARHDRVYFELLDNNYNKIIESKNAEITTALSEISSISNNITFILDTDCFNEIIKSNFKKCNIYTSQIDLKTFENLISENKLEQLSYFDLDATYARLSEAERTKCGE